VVTSPSRQSNGRNHSFPLLFLGVILFLFNFLVAQLCLCCPFSLSSPVLLLIFSRLSDKRLFLEPPHPSSFLRSPFSPSPIHTLHISFASLFFCYSAFTTLGPQCDFQGKARYFFFFDHFHDLEIISEWCYFLNSYFAYFGSLLA